MVVTLDEDRRELVTAERRLFAKLGIEYRSERVALMRRADRGGRQLSRARPHPGTTGSLSPERVACSSVRMDT